MLFFVAASLLAASAASSGAADEVRGIPFTRLDTFEEVAGVSGPSHLSFDRFGRVAAVEEGAYVVLNDTTWIDLAEKNRDGPQMLNAVRDADGTIYFGGFVSWGILEATASGKVRPRSMVPANCPSWVMSTFFTEILCRPQGVYFGGANGVVFWNRETKTHTFFAVDSVTRLFAFHGDVFVSSNTAHVQRIDIAHGVLADTAFRPVICNAVELSDGGLLVSTIGQRLLVYRNGEPAPWANALGPRLASRILTMKRLPDGCIAMGVSGMGIFVLRESGELISSVTLPAYRRANDLASNEPGVLWAATESGIAKIIYGSPITTVGQPLGLPVSWPQLVRWQGRLIVATAGGLYEPVPTAEKESTRFQLVPNQPVTGVWGIAATDRQLLVGSPSGVYVVEPDGAFTRILANLDVARLVLVGPDLCFVVGAREIAALRLADGRWSECAPRIAGLGYPSVAHATRHSVWLELGANRAARLAWRDGKIQAQRFESFPWAAPRWIDVSVLGDVVVLTGGEKGRIFFDETTETLRDAPALRTLLERSPFWIVRLRADRDGLIWAAHENGVLTIDPATGQYDAARYDLLHEGSPHIHLLNDGETWVSTADTLFRIEPRADTTRKTFTPRLVSVRDKRDDTELLPPRDGWRSLPPLAYARNSLEFRFFSGGYAFRRPPAYQVRLDDEHWTRLDAATPLSVSNLREGRHRLAVKLVNGHGQPGDSTNFDFEILPPWYRTWYAYALYAVAGVSLVGAVARLSVYRARKRNRELAELVDRRTEELRGTMQKLNEETRNSATMGERQRLAEEIHDSLQQGLTGLTLQIDATLNLPELSPEARSRLGVARSMLSYSRHEVENVVRGMESPLLDRADLAAALRKLSDFIGTGTVKVQVAVSGPPTALPAAVQHNLLRIAQEAVTNAVRHGAADSIVIALDYASDALTLTIRDNGRGFNAHAAPQQRSSHFGLRSLRSRAAKIGARPQIESEPGKGTIIKLIVPHVPSPLPDEHRP